MTQMDANRVSFVYSYTIGLSNPFSLAHPPLPGSRGNDCEGTGLKAVVGSLAEALLAEISHVGGADGTCDGEGGKQSELGG